MRERASSRASKALEGARLLQLVASGTTVKAAAASLHITEARAKKLWQSEMQRTLEENSDLRGKVLARELEHLRILRSAVMPLVIKGDQRAVTNALRIAESYRAMLGLDAAQKVEVTVREVNEAVDEIADIIDGKLPEGVTPLRRVTAVPEAM